MQRSRRFTQTVAGLALAGAIAVGIASPASALSGYAIGGKTTVKTTTTTKYAAVGDPVIIPAPSMRSTEGCPVAVDENGEVDEDAPLIPATITHADGTIYDCASGNYIIN